jgi:uncharacterized OB-fold protein
MTSKCFACEHVIWPPSNVCPKCLSTNIEWVDIDGNGKLIEFSESFLMERPSIFGVVELNGNIRLLTKIRCDNITQLKKGMSVRMIKCGVKSNQPYYEFQPI